jgi:quercetin dioxygenase-like cupin family protein
MEEPMTDTLNETEQRNMLFYQGGSARSLDEDGMMGFPDIAPEVYENLDLSPIANAQQVDVLFKGDGPDGFSLVRARFAPGFKLPRHSHSADCLYYVVSGEARMGTRVLQPGDGFFIRAEAPYTYTAGPDGVEVLEFRAATSFDMKIFDKTVERWKPIVAAAAAGAAAWSG